VEVSHSGLTTAELVWILTLINFLMNKFLSDEYCCLKRVGLLGDYYLLSVKNFVARFLRPFFLPLSASTLATEAVVSPDSAYKFQS